MWTVHYKHYKVWWISFQFELHDSMASWENLIHILQSVSKDVIGVFQNFLFSLALFYRNVLKMRGKRFGTFIPCVFFSHKNPLK